MPINWYTVSESNTATLPCKRWLRTQRPVHWCIRRGNDPASGGFQAPANPSQLRMRSGGRQGGRTLTTFPSSRFSRPISTPTLRPSGNGDVDRSRTCITGVATQCLAFRPRHRSGGATGNRTLRSSLQGTSWHPCTSPVIGNPSGNRTPLLGFGDLCVPEHESLNWCRQHGFEPA